MSNRFTRKSILCHSLLITIDERLKMNCRKCERYFSAYMDNQIDDKQRGQFERHLESCSRCAEEFARFKRVVTLTVETPMIQPSPHFERSLKAKLANNESDAQSRSTYHWNYAFAFVMLCLLIALTGIYVHDYVGYERNNKQIMAGREFVPTIRINTGDNTLTNFVMPNVPTIQVSAPAFNHLEIEDAGDFVLPQVTHSSQYEQNIDYVLEKVSLISDDNKGVWH